MHKDAREKKTGLAFRPAQSGSVTRVAAGVGEVVTVCVPARLSVSPVAWTSHQEPPVSLVPIAGVRVVVPSSDANLEEIPLMTRVVWH